MNLETDSLLFAYVKDSQKWLSFLYPELLKVHQENDKAVMRAYGFQRAAGALIGACLFYKNFSTAPNCKIRIYNLNNKRTCGIISISMSPFVFRGILQSGDRGFLAGGIHGAVQTGFY